jgi:ATP phosphoribosyltransferase
LIEQEIILNSQACLYANAKSLADKSDIINKLSFRIESVIRARKFNYILFNIPNEKINIASSILPGLKSPTIVPLVEENWSSMHSVIAKNESWEIIDELKKVGAQGILISKVSKIVI